MDKESARFALFIADTAFIACVLMGPIFLAVGRYLDGGITLAGAVVAAAYCIRRGPAWPGQVLVRHWRWYL